MTEGNKSLPPSGPWSGYYLYGFSGPKHHMQLSLTFRPDGTMLGEGIDDIASFTIDGTFDSISNQATWTKTYRGMHSVEYHGLYDYRSICGAWTLLFGGGVSSGNFWIWPATLSEGTVLTTEVEEPVKVRSG